MKRIFSLALAAALLAASLSACGPTQQKQVDLAAFAQTVQTSHSFPNLDRIDPEDEEFGVIMLENAYPGLRDMDLEQAEIYLAKSSFSGVEFALIQAGNTADAAKVKEIFDARVAAKTTEGPGNYPEEVELWQHNSAIVSRGNYVMLVNHEDSEAIVSEFNALFE